jgi:hypothetical protein
VPVDRQVLRQQRVPHLDLHGVALRGADRRAAAASDRDRKRQQRSRGRQPMAAGSTQQSRGSIGAPLAGYF